MSDVSVSRITVPVLTFLGTVGLIGGGFYWAASMQVSIDRLKEHIASTSGDADRITRSEKDIDALRADVERLEAHLMNLEGNGAPFRP